MPVLKRRLRYQDSKDEKRKRSTRRFKDSTLRKKSASLKPSRKKMLESPDKKSVFRAVQQHQKQHRNATQKTESKGSAQSAKYNIMKRSSGSDEKVLGELRSIFSEDSKTGQKKTVKKREDSSVALKSGDGGSDSSKAESDEDKFKKWLLDEYYRTMALSFASMRKKRMAIHQDTLDLRKMKRDEQQADDQFQAVEEKLRGIEDAMIGEALELVRDGAGDESDLRAINAGVASRLDAAYDLESVRQSLGHLEATLDTMRRREDGDDAGQPEDADDGPQGSWAQLVDKGCPALQVLSSGCAPLEDLTAFDASLETEVLSACSWHQVCYTCGSFFGLSSDDCDEGLGVANPQLARLVLDYLLRRQVFFKRSTPALCSTSCVSDFLLNH
ncbi:hypothetical protein IscW_ISCW001432 [Ixodes scapularis]|uniref:Uncharacterized protein n=1 Tax=Ixodes scapularis TaxID=6945 RepID=B7P4J5_IXOSC|nr:hypothetical protein IscW_ISCW001432 [Ixodes scapularis]|eukprot:XP_002406123.1 hypothetical protein IscW_ISCW001432 [Ixodes scapularis]